MQPRLSPLKVIFGGQARGQGHGSSAGQTAVNMQPCSFDSGQKVGRLPLEHRRLQGGWLPPAAQGRFNKRARRRQWRGRWVAAKTMPIMPQPQSHFCAQFGQVPLEKRGLGHPDVFASDLRLANCCLTRSNMLLLAP